MLRESPIERLANKRLKTVLNKYWPLKFSFRREGCWLAEVRNSRYVPFKIESYTEKNDYILRITDKYTPTICPNHLNNACDGNCYDTARPHNQIRFLELTFHWSEFDKILPWVFENYFCIKKISELLDDELIHNAPMYGSPSYLWTKRAKKEYEGR